MWVQLAITALSATSLVQAVDVDDLNNHDRVKRQLPLSASQEANSASEDYVADYAGNDNNESPKDEPTDTFRDTFTDTGNNDDINEDKFGTDTFDDNPVEEKSKSKEEEESKESKPKKKAKKHKYLKKTLEFLKRVLDPNKLMENAYITEMLRRFSHHEEPDYETRESKEESSEEKVHIPKTTKKRRGRPRKKDKIPPGITGVLKKGVMSLTQLQLDKKKLRRRMKLIKRIARKAKKPLKTAVKIFLSSRNQGVGGYGGGGYGNTNY